MMKYKPTIGLEIHAELKTKTKMFCNSLNDPDEVEPNVNVCPVCMAHPGTLPVINKEAVKSVIKVGVSLGGTIARFTEFDRKNYFYPDIPKGYQISQYAYPIVKGGSLLGVDITRVHLEEDTARSSHDQGDYSLVDFNRAGVPLMELVTEPVIHSAEDAGRFGRELQLLLRTLGVSDANMEKGEMRVEVNISISKDENLGTKVEVKNINSFKAAEKAISYEIERQSKILEEGGEIVQETRGWDEKKEETFSQRKKETSDDYRYFPDPDLPKLYLDRVPEFDIDLILKELPELPESKRVRYREAGIKDEDVEVYVSNTMFGHFIDNVLPYLETKEEIQSASNYITSDLMALVREGGEESFVLSPKRFAELIQMGIKGMLSSRGIKDVLVILYKEGGVPQEIAEKHSLLQVRDEALLSKIVDEVLEANVPVVAEYKGGKEASLKFLVGQGMKISKGSADPVMLEEFIKLKVSSQ